MAWAVIATIAAAVCAFGWSSSSAKWNAVMAGGSQTTINELIAEDTQNYQAGSKLVDEYNKLAQNAQNECDIIDNYFGSTASSDCSDEIFGSGSANSTSVNDYGFSTDNADSMQTQLDNINNPPSSD